MAANSSSKKHSLGDRLQEVMEWRGFYKRSLARAIDKDEAYVGRIIRDEIEDPGVHVMYAICTVLRCQFIYLIGGVGPKWLEGTEPREKPPSADKRLKANRSSRPSESGEHTLQVVPKSVAPHREVSSAPPRGHR
jgi:transcriptional regulator with XRE-family HTH domain